MAEPSVFRPGGISYLRIPAPDLQTSAGNEIGVWQQGVSA